jgi:hypothetical protein
VGAFSFSFSLFAESFGTETRKLLLHIAGPYLTDAMSWVTVAICGAEAGISLDARLRIVSVAGEAAEAGVQLGDVVYGVGDAAVVPAQDSTASVCAAMRAAPRPTTLLLFREAASPSGWQPLPPPVRRRGAAPARAVAALPPAPASASVRSVGGWLRRPCCRCGATGLFASFTVDAEQRVASRHASEVSGGCAGCGCAETEDATETTHLPSLQVAARGGKSAAAAGGGLGCDTTWMPWAALVLLLLGVIAVASGATSESSSCYGSYYYPFSYYCYTYISDGGIAGVSIGSVALFLSAVFFIVWLAKCGCRCCSGGAVGLHLLSSGDDSLFDEYAMSRGLLPANVADAAWASLLWAWARSRGTELHDPPAHAPPTLPAVAVSSLGAARVSLRAHACGLVEFSHTPPRDCCACGKDCGDEGAREEVVAAWAPDLRWLRATSRGECCGSRSALVVGLPGGQAHALPSGDLVAAAQGARRLPRPLVALGAAWLGRPPRAEAPPAVFSSATAARGGCCAGSCCAGSQRAAVDADFTTVDTTAAGACCVPRQRLTFRTADVPYIYMTHKGSASCCCGDRRLAVIIGTPGAGGADRVDDDGGGQCCCARRGSRGGGGPVIVYTRSGPTYARAAQAFVADAVHAMRVAAAPEHAPAVPVADVVVYKLADGYATDAAPAAMDAAGAAAQLRPLQSDTDYAYAALAGERRPLMP